MIPPGHLLINRGIRLPESVGYIYILPNFKSDPCCKALVVSVVMICVGVPYARETLEVSLRSCDMKWC